MSKRRGRDVRAIRGDANLTPISLLPDPFARAFPQVDEVHPTGQKSKKCPQVEGHMFRLSARHAKLRRDGYRKDVNR